VALASRVEALLGRRPTSWRRVTGGYTRTGRWVARLADGSSAFVKAAVDDETAGWLAAEQRVYAAVAGPFLPRVLASEGGPRPVLVLEDLSGARWPPPWRDGDVARVVEALDAVHATPPPPGTPPLSSLWDLRTGWPAVAADPAPFLALGLADAAWLERALPSLLAAEAAARLDEGGALLHQDVRSDNIAFVDGRAVLVDWSWACRGNPVLDLAAFLPSLRAEGGPRPEDVLRDEPEAAAAYAGWWASRAGLPPPPDGSRVRDVQRTQLEVALPWACRALGLEPPARTTSTRSGSRPG
jgi:hypothetical protein